MTVDRTDPKTPLPPESLEPNRRLTIRDVLFGQNDNGDPTVIKSLDTDSIGVSIWAVWVVIHPPDCWVHVGSPDCAGVNLCVVSEKVDEVNQASNSLPLPW